MYVCAEALPKLVGLFTSHLVRHTEKNLARNLMSNASYLTSFSFSERSSSFARAAAGTCRSPLTRCLQRIAISE